ncbi:glycoside hydrolase family 78 protein [Cadophora sp. DSE1049]|nr:glycoside hydrolase family 78 protein [Cadophora sp. DSE1049]
MTCVAKALVSIIILLGNGWKISTGAAGSFCESTITLQSDGKTPGIFIIGHGVDVGGLPTFQVVSRSGDTSVFEMAYSESRALLDTYMGDGPLPLAASLDIYRVNRYNVTNQTTITNRLIQGGERYQKLNLSTAGELVLKNVGIISKTATTPIDQLPGSFQCSDERLNQIWQTGARSLQLTEIPAETIPEYYVVSDQGLFAENQSPQPYSSDTSPFLTQYLLEFFVMPTKGGFGYTVLSDTLGSGIYIFVNLANSSISANLGSTERDSPALASAMLDPNLAFNEWHTVSTFVNMTLIEISIDGKPIMNFTQTSAFVGSFGLGASLGQSAYFQNVTLQNLQEQPIYTASLTQSSVLIDFLAGTNMEPVSVDGARRDRIAYSGDVDITVGPIFASTRGSDFLNGTLRLLGASQLLPGFFAPEVKIQQPPRTSIIQSNQTALIGYSFNLITAMTEFHLMTGDVNFANRWAPVIVRMLDWANTQLVSSGLFNVSSSIGGDWDVYDPAQSGAVAKFNAVYAFALQQALPLLNAANVTTKPYTDRLAALKIAINAKLWNPTLSAYQLSDSVRDTPAQDANAFAILANVPQGNITASTILTTMSKELFLPTGALPFSNASLARGFKQRMSPYSSGYHLRAAFAAHDEESAKHLLYTLWAPMANTSNANYTGCFWEALTANGEPGLGASTSLCHAWSSAPTGELSRNVLGIQAVMPGFSQWRVAPQTLGLTWANGTHPTPHGDLAVSWAMSAEGKFGMNVSSPSGTNGTVSIPLLLQSQSNNTMWMVNGKLVAGTSFPVIGGEVFNLTQAGCYMRGAQGDL